MSTTTAQDRDLSRHDRCALRVFKMLAEKMNAQLDTQFINRSRENKYIKISELHAEFDLGDCVLNLVYYRQVQTNSGFFGYLLTDSIQERNATNRELNSRLGQSWMDVVNAIPWQPA